MKVYNLCCEKQHRFEGWFSSEDDFNRQLSQDMLACPVCDDRHIRRLPSAPRLNLGGTQPEESKAVELPQVWLAAARKLIEQTEDVGERFAEEARRIHYQEAPERGIRGVATPDEREALAEEGIDVLSFPLPDALKHPLQ